MTASQFDCTFFAHPQERNSGDYLHRVLWPAQALGQYLPVSALQTTHPNHQDAIRSTGVLVIKMVADIRLLDVLKMRNRHGLVTVYEVSDDFECFPPQLPTHAFYSRPEVQGIIRELAKRSTAVQFSSGHLLQKYGLLNENRALFRNQLMTVPPLTPPPDTRLNLGWAGSIGHLEEARGLARMLARWSGRDKVKIAVMAAPVVVESFRHERLDVEEVAPGGMDAYFRFLQRLDIGLAVLGKDDFSAGRSDGKLLEYAAHGVVPVCSRAGSYAETVRDQETGFLFGDEAELFAILDRLVDNPDLRQQVRTRAYHYVSQERTHAKAVLDRLAFYRGLVETHPRSLESRSPLAPQKAGFVEAIHPVENLLYQAMALHGNGQFQEAFALYTKALESEPNFFLIWERVRDLCQTLGLKEDAALFGAKAEALYPYPS